MNYTKIKCQRQMDILMDDPKRIDQVFLDCVECGILGLIEIPNARDFFTKWESLAPKDIKRLLIEDVSLSNYIYFGALDSDDIITLSLHHHKLFPIMDMDKIDNKGWVTLLTSDSNKDNGGLNVEYLCKWDKLTVEDYLQIIKHRPDYITYYQRSPIYSMYIFMDMLEFFPEIKQYILR
jgi:hypothetical protein